jgi:hypothetical protein
MSSKDQNEGRQLVSMNDLEIDDRGIFIDKQSGRNFQR